MPAELPTAMLTISRLDGSKKTWRVKLTPQTPYEQSALRAALISRFVSDPDVSPNNFDLTVLGTAGAPVFELREREEFFGDAEEVT
jgi:hypothetical protein